MSEVTITTVDYNIKVEQIRLPMGKLILPPGYDKNNPNNGWAIITTSNNEVLWARVVPNYD